MFGPAHGHGIGKHIRSTSEDALQVETGSLYPALHRLEAQGWISSEWQLSDKGKRAKYDSLTRTGPKTARRRTIEMGSAVGGDGTES